MTVHYQSPVAMWALTPSCGSRGAETWTVTLGDVTCLRCRGTLVFRMDTLAGQHPDLSRSTVRRMTLGRAS